MSPVPGVTVTSRAARAPRGLSTFSGTWFVAGLTERGTHEAPVKVSSLDEFVATFGNRVSYGQLYDAAETFFAEGGGDLYVSRVVGPAPVKASLQLMDQSGGAGIATLVIGAKSVGDWANGGTGGVSVASEAGTLANTFRVIVYWNALEVERFDNLSMDPASARYAPTVLLESDYVRGTDLNSATAMPNKNPRVTARANLAGGADDRASVTDAHWLTALNRFARDLGPGQVSMPGRTAAQAHSDLIAHARTRNRTAYLDTADGASKATMLAAAAAGSALALPEYAGMFGGWVEIPALATGGTVRKAPPSAYAAGRTAARDRAAGTAGSAPAGDQGKADYALGVTVPTGGFTDDDYDELNAAGVNMIREFPTRGVQLYGFRSLSLTEDWRQLTANRLRVSLVARLEAIAQGYVFRSIDGKGLLFGELNGALAGECLRDYQAGALYGEQPDEAFRVDTGETVNTAQTIADGEIKANVYARFSPFGEQVLLSIVKVPVSSPV